MPSAVFTQELINTLKGFLNDFREVPSTEKMEVVKRAAQAVLVMKPKLTKPERKEMRKVNMIIIPSSSGGQSLTVT
jgi:hypothetical protein